MHMFLYLLRCRSKQIGLVNNELILYLEQLKMVQTEMNTSQWHSPLCYYLNSLAVLRIWADLGVQAIACSYRRSKKLPHSPAHLPHSEALGTHLMSPSTTELTLHIYGKIKGQ